MKTSLKICCIILAFLISLLLVKSHAGASVLTVLDPGQPAGVTILAGTAGTLAGRLSLSVDTGSSLITSLKISNAGTAVHEDDIFAISLYADANGNGLIDPEVDNFLGHSSWSEGETLYVFSDINVEITSGAPEMLLIAMHAAAGAGVGNTYTMNVNELGVTLDGSDTVEPFSIAGSSFTMTESEASGSANASAPMVIILNPLSSGTVSGTFPVQVQVHNQDSLNNLVTLELSTDSGTSYSYSFDLINDRNLNYNVGSNAGIYETALTLSPGGYSLVARATNALALTSTSPVSPVLVNPAGKGDGMLLRRDNSDQLCIDCHALKGHSSQSVGGKYGSWGVSCRSCHTPHNTTNIYLIRNSVSPPFFGTYNASRTVKFSKTSGTTSSSSIVEATYTNPDNTGPCQVCHTRTSGPGDIARWRNSGNVDSHYADPENPVRCTVCHPHSQGFKAEPDITNPNCNACHLSASGGGNDIDNYIWDDGITATIDLDEWLSSGHGSSVGYASGNSGAGFRNEIDGGCLYCHDEQTGHNEAGMAFFRLKDQGTGPSGNWGAFNGTCLICHDETGSTGYQPAGYSSPRNASVKVDPQAHEGVKHDDAHDGGRDCWDCHDPHGDSTSPSLRWYMIQRNPVQDRDNTTEKPSTIAPTVTFQGGSTYTDYTSGGLCVNCHTSTDHYAGSITDDHPNDDYGTTEPCTNCHLHDAGFENIDNCPGDPVKIEPGICGCGMPDIDGDGDGYYVCDDCDDSDPYFNPDTYWYLDLDGDGFGTYTVSQQQCSQPAGPLDYVLNNLDFDDSDPGLGPPVKIDRIYPYFYLTLQEAYNNAEDADVIQCVEVTFNENLSAYINKSVIIQGGYDATFSVITGNTILEGNIVINDGMLSIEGLTVQ